jgi:hypothetical protein
MRNVNKICYKCGAEDPDYEVVGYGRNCSECGGKASVLEITEMTDLLNELYLRGLLPEGFVEDVTDEEYNELELDFNNDLIEAHKDAFLDYLEDYDYD